jgi:hypothetical protein
MFNILRTWGLNRQIRISSRFRGRVRRLRASDRWQPDITAQRVAFVPLLPLRQQMCCGLGRKWPWPVRNGIYRKLYHAYSRFIIYGSAYLTGHVAWTYVHILTSFPSHTGRRTKISNFFFLPHNLSFLTALSPLHFVFRTLRNHLILLHLTCLFTLKFISNTYLGILVPSVLLSNCSYCFSHNCVNVLLRVWVTTDGV